MRRRCGPISIEFGQDYRDAARRIVVTFSPEVQRTLAEFECEQRDERRRNIERFEEHLAAWGRENDRGSTEVDLVGLLHSVDLTRQVELTTGVFRRALADVRKHNDDPRVGSAGDEYVR